MIVPDFHGMWNIPPPAPFFTGRENVIANMTQHLKVRGCGVFSQVIAGQGGVGKTQVGFAYAEAMQEYYGKRGYLIDSETRQTILTACIELMVVLQFYKELGIDDGKGMADVRTQLSRFRPSQIQNHLIQRLLLLPKILLILDNVEDKELVTPLLKFFGLYTNNKSAFPMNALTEKKGKSWIYLINAYTFKQKGIARVKQFRDNIFHATCYWPLNIKKQSCCICGCNQPGFMLER